jgi:E1A/CREB-binding protein
MHWQQVPGAENLRVRVINNVMKKCEVKPRFGETFSASGNYPSEFSYRQRVLVMFQVSHLLTSTSHLIH